MPTEPLQDLLQQAFPDATELSVVDRTGGGDHFQVTVASPRFEGLSLVDQHRLVYDALGHPARRRLDPRAPNQDERIPVTLRDQISEIIQTEPVALFMKGTPSFVACGNSQRALTALRAAGAPVTAVDILPDPRFRQELSAVSGWPTIPQIFVNGELVGGADIVEELQAAGELERKLSEALGDGYREARDERVVELAPA